MKTYTSKEYLHGRLESFVMGGAAGLVFGLSLGLALGIWMG